MGSKLLFMMAGAACLSCAIALTAEQRDRDDGLLIGPRALSTAEFSALVSRLNGADDSASLTAAVELGERAGARALKPLSEFYTHGNSKRRLAAVNALTANSAVVNEALTALLLKIVLGDNSQAVRELATSRLALLKGADGTFDELTKFIAHGERANSLLRSRAVHSAAHSGSKNCGQFLLKLLTDLDDAVACSAALELGHSRELAAADALLQLLDSPRAELRTAAVQALQELSGKQFKFDLLRWGEWRATAAASAVEGLIAQPAPAAYPAQPPPVDLIVAFDTTGSFLHVWSDVGPAIDAVLHELCANEPFVRVGLIRYRSVDPRATLRYTLKVTPLTSTIETVRRELATASFGGGSGALHEGLRAALNDSAWRPGARKVVLIVGDDSPSSPVENALQSCINLARDAGEIDHIQVNTLYAKTTAGEENRQTYRLIAAAGIGRFYEFDKAAKHIVEHTADSESAPHFEEPAELARKWLEPLKK